MKNNRKGRPPGTGCGLGIVEATRFTPEQIEAINDVARELRIPRAEAIRKATTLGLPLVRAAMKMFADGGR